MILPGIVLTFFLVAWLLFSIFGMRPLIRGLPTNEISDVSGSIIQASGILIGFTGLSAFFYLGKTGELSMSVCSKAVDATRFWVECEMEYESVLREIKWVEFKILSDQKGSKKSSTKEIEKLKKEIHEVKDCADKEYHEMREFENQIKKQSKESVEVLGKATNVLSALTITTMSVFIGSLVLSFLLKLTGQPRFLEGAIDFMVIGIASLIYHWISQQQFASRVAKLLNAYLVMNSDMMSLHLEYKNMKENLKLLLAIERSKLGLT